VLILSHMQYGHIHGHRLQHTIKLEFVRQYQRNSDRVSKSLEQLSTGKRINRPSDDPAGFIAAEGLRGDIVVLSAESRAAESQRFNVRQEQSQLGNVQQLLNEVRGQLVGAADGTLSPQQRKNIQQGIDASLDAIDRILGPKNVRHALNELRSGGKANVVDGDIEAAAQLVESELRSVGQARVAAAAYEKYQIDLPQQLRQDQIIIVQQTLSQIEDTDFAKAASELVQGQILSEAALIALAYANREQSALLQTLLRSFSEEA